MFDNATGIGRRVCKEVRTTDLFGAFAAHYGFAYSFCSPASGNEKGNVENKVGFIRRNLFTPPAQVHNIDIFNKHLLDKCLRLSDKPHWIKGEPESQLFVEDSFALSGLPQSRSTLCATYLPGRTNKKGMPLRAPLLLKRPEPCRKDLNRGTAGVQRVNTYRRRRARMRAQARIRGCAHRHDQSRKPTSAFVRKAGRMEKLQGQKRDA